MKKTEERKKKKRKQKKKERNAAPRARSISICEMALRGYRRGSLLAVVADVAAASFAFGSSH